MASRAEEKQRLKEERLAAEKAEQAKATRNRRLGILGAVAVVAIAAVLGALALTGGGKDTVEAADPDLSAMFEGIPEQGMTLGNPNAEVEVEEFMDLQCPACKAFSQQNLPTLINEYVRTNKIKLTLRPIAIIGPESRTASEALLAAGEQDKAWQYAETFFANQGAENAGYINDDFLTGVAEQVKGLDVQRLLKDRDASTVQDSLQATEQRQNKLGVSSTPSFYATKDGKTQPVQILVGDDPSIARSLDPIVGTSNAG